MSISRIAVRYAKPLLDLAEEKKILEEVKADIITFQGVCKANRDFVLMLKSPIIPHLKKATIIKKIFSGKVNDLTAQFFDIITKKSREMYLPDVAKEFIAMYNKKMGYQEATVTTTFTIDDTTKKAVEKLVSDITGMKPLLTEKIDPELIGGYILKLGDQQIDESISGHLGDLKLKFKKETI